MFHMFYVDWELKGRKKIGVKNCYGWVTGNKQLFSSPHLFVRPKKRNCLFRVTVRKKIG